jgi:hypothetical protein
LVYGVKVHTRGTKRSPIKIFVLQRRLVSLPENLAGLSMLAAELRHTPVLSYHFIAVSRQLKASGCHGVDSLSSSTSSLSPSSVVSFDNFVISHELKAWVDIIAVDPFGVHSQRNLESHTAASSFISSQTSSFDFRNEFPTA